MNWLDKIVQNIDFDNTNKTNKKKHKKKHGKKLISLRSKNKKSYQSNNSTSRFDMISETNSSNIMSDPNTNTKTNTKINNHDNDHDYIIRVANSEFNSVENCIGWGNKRLLCLWIIGFD